LKFWHRRESAGVGEGKVFAGNSKLMEPGLVLAVDRVDVDAARG